MRRSLRGGTTARLRFLSSGTGREVCLSALGVYIGGLEMKRAADGGQETLQQLKIMPRLPTPDILDSFSREELRAMARERRFGKQVCCPAAPRRWEGVC